MKKPLLLALASMLISMSNAAETTIYLSPNGCDSNMGDINSPMQTLHGAQVKVREIVKENPNQEITLLLREGRYEMSERLKLTFEDVGEKLTIASYQDEQAVISAGKQVSGWRKCDVYPEGTPDAAKGNLWVADIPAGVKNFKSMFDGEERLIRAKSEKWQKPMVEEYDTQANGRWVSENKHRVFLRMMPFDDEIKDWDNLSDVEVFFNPVNWTMNFIPIEAVDMEKKIAYLEFEANSIPFTYGIQSWAWVENVIDYLDEAGEWCVNTKSGKIYYWPESGAPSNEIYVPQMREVIIVEGKIQYYMPNDIPVKNIHFENLKFTHADRSVWHKNHKGWGVQHDWDTFDYDNAILRFRGAEDCSVTGCEFSNSAGSAMRLDLHAQNIKVENNYIADMGHGGIFLGGYGPGTKDVNKGNTISNNIIHHVGQIITHGNAIFIWQSGENLVSHNYIHDVAREAVDLSGPRCGILMSDGKNNTAEAFNTIRWHEINETIDPTIEKITERYSPFLHTRNNIIERNRVERAMLLSRDGGTINISGAGDYNIIRYNYLYEHPNFNAMRTDDWQDKTIMEYNIFHNIGYHGIQYKGINTLRNNMFINCKTALHFMPYTHQVFDPKGTIIQRNIIYSDREGDEPNNVYPLSHDHLPMAVKETKEMPYEYEMDFNAYFGENSKEDLAEKQRNGIEANGVVMDPKFADLENRDYTIKNKALLKAIGFETFDCTLDSFGVTSDYPAKFVEKDPTLN